MDSKCGELTNAILPEIRLIACPTQEKVQPATSQKLGPTWPIPKGWNFHFEAQSDCLNDCTLIVRLNPPDKPCHYSG